MALRFFRHGELHLVVLALVSGRPMHGYDLMAELGRLFGPRYRPSAGSIYPAVEALTAEGLLTSEEVAGRRVYSITPLGTEALVARSDALAALEVRTGVHLVHGPRLDAALARFEARVRAAASRLDPDDLERRLDEAAGIIESAARDQSPSNERTPDQPTDPSQEDP